MTETVNCLEPSPDAGIERLKALKRGEKESEASWERKLVCISSGANEAVRGNSGVDRLPVLVPATCTDLLQLDKCSGIVHAWWYSVGVLSPWHTVDIPAASE